MNHFALQLSICSYLLNASQSNNLEKLGVCAHIFSLLLQIQAFEFLERSEQNNPLDNLEREHLYPTFKTELRLYLYWASP